MNWCWRWNLGCFKVSPLGCQTYCAINRQVMGLGLNRLAVLNGKATKKSHFYHFCHFYHFNVSIVLEMRFIFASAWLHLHRV